MMEDRDGCGSRRSKRQADMSSVGRDRGQEGIRRQQKSAQAFPPAGVGGLETCKALATGRRNLRGPKLRPEPLLRLDAGNRHPAFLHKLGLHTSSWMRHAVARFPRNGIPIPKPWPELRRPHCRNHCRAKTPGFRPTKHRISADSTISADVGFPRAERHIWAQSRRARVNSTQKCVVCTHAKVTA